MKQFFVVHADLRLLVADVDAPFLRIRMISAHAPIAKEFSARAAFFKLLVQYVMHPEKVLLFIDANARPEETISTAKSVSNTYLRDACNQFTEFLSMVSPALLIALLIPGPPTKQNASMIPTIK